MKYQVRVNGRCFEVEITDLQSRPIIAVIEGERFEIWPETTSLIEGSDTPEKETTSALPGRPPQHATSTQQTDPAVKSKPLATGNGAGLDLVRAPIPGVIVSIAVQPHDIVAVGQELCVLEAMKMKNSIRAIRAGQIAAVKISPGQPVKHREVLMEYTG